MDGQGEIANADRAVFARLLSCESESPKDGEMWPLSGGGYVIRQGGETHALGMGAAEVQEQIAESISSKADLSALNGYIHNGAETAVIHDLTCDGNLVAANAYIGGYAKTDELSSKADISAVHGDYIVDGNGNAVSANLSYKALNADTEWTAHNLTSEDDYHLSAESEYAYSYKTEWERLTLEYSANKWRFRYKMFDGEGWWDAAEGEWQAGEDAVELYRDGETWRMTRKASPTGKLATVAQLAEIPQINDGRGNVISADLSYRQTKGFFDGWTVTGNGTGGELSADGGDT